MLMALADPDRFARHGRVRVAPGATHLSHADGTPFFYLADTAWNGPLLSADADWAEYLDFRAAQGFTAIQFIAHAPWTAALTDRDGRTAFTGDAARPLDDAFHDRLDAKVAAINARGMLAVPALAWAANFGKSSKLNIGHTAGAGALIPIVRAQVARLARHQVMLILAGDGAYNFWRARKWRAVGRAVFDGLADRPAVAMHPAGLSWPYRRFRDERWLDVRGYQSGHGHQPSTMNWLTAGPPATTTTPPRPTINLEPVYEDIAPGRDSPPFTRDDVRRAAYVSALSTPTAGVAYGAHGVWSWQAHAAEPLNHPGMGLARPWHAAMRFEGARDMSRLAALFTSVPWWTLRPVIRAQWMTKSNGARVRVQLPPRHPTIPRFAASASGDLVVAYYPAGGSPVTVERPASTTLEWFDPRTAARTPAGAAPHLAPPDERDWLLVGQSK
jgi:hypothetical protein